MNKLEITENIGQINFIKLNRIHTDIVSDLISTAAI